VQQVTNAPPQFAVVTQMVQLAAAPSAAWALVRDFTAWHVWHPGIVSTDVVKGHGNTKGSVRLLTAPDGARFLEELTAHHPMSRSLRFRAIESPLPVRDWISTLHVSWMKGASCVVWQSAFTVTEAEDEAHAARAISRMARAGLDNLGNVVN
jgi:mxaD protein